MVLKAKVTDRQYVARAGECARHEIETVHGLFRWCARHFPFSVAVVSGERRVTYRELQTLADDYAVELQSRGVARGDLVPVLMADTPEFIAALLAVLECGAAYAALDDRWPVERLASAIRVLDAKLLVTAVAGDWSVPVVAPPSSAKAVGRTPDRIVVRGDEPCAVFFAPGSAGVPRVVFAPHSGVVDLFTDSDFAMFGPGNIVPQLAPASWDGFILDCWSVLLNGGTSVFLEDPVLVPSALRRAVAEQGVNGAFLTTTMFNRFVDEDLDAFDGMHWLLTGGEPASIAHLRRFAQRFPDIELTNVYGPVQSTAVVTERRAAAVADQADAGVVPLHRLLTGKKAFVLDSDRTAA